jgi:hypothetical protein
MKYFFIVFFTVISLYSEAQSGIKGFIKNKNNKPLAFATIYIKELKTGTITNEDGYFEYRLPAGEYNLNFQYMGYKPDNIKVNVKEAMLNLDIKLAEQSINLSEVNIVASAEDPAYSIMRKLVAMSKYHLLKVKSYKAKVYIKGFFKIDIPKIVYKAAKSEGIDTVEVNTSESFNEIEYEYPNTYRQTVISARSNQGDTISNEVYNYIQGSIYASSLMSPSVFGLYRFKLEGSFYDRGYEIHKIKITPRSKGPDTYSGYIYVIDKLWAIHSLNLDITQLGFKTHIEQIYAPVINNIWMPVSHHYDIKGKLFGVKINHIYYATVSDYSIVENPEINIRNFELIDERIENEIAKAKLEDKKQDFNITQNDSSISEINERKFTIKELKKVLKEAEKKEEKNREDSRLFSDYTLKFDSLAAKRSVEYWDSIRPVPLTEIEKKPGFLKKNDSINQARKQDTASGFAFLGNTFGNIFLGSNVRISNKFSFKYPSPLVHLNFNTVEGYNINLPLEIKYNADENNGFSILPTLRYGSSGQFYHNTVLKYEYRSGKYLQKNSISLEGGKYVSQFNPENPVVPFINSITSLFWVENYFKIYRKDFLAIVLKQNLNPYLLLNLKLEYSNREELFNTSNDTWVNKKGREYSPNTPFNIEKSNTSFGTSKAALIDVNLSYRPFIRFYRYNNKIRVSDDRTPIINLAYSAGLKDFLGSNTDFHRIEGSISHKINGIRRDLDIKVFGGTTFANSSDCFIDYKHFNGNSTLIQTRQTADGYFLLDYYKYSTSSDYLGAYSQLSFRKLLLTQNLWLNLLGIKEVITFNYLKTSNSPDYVEFGYGIDNIFRLFKIQAVTSFENGKYQMWGIRIGLSGLINIRD